MPSDLKPKGDRQCPALNETITARRCGSERGTKLACPASCQHSPYALDNYDQCLQLTRGVIAKILNFIRGEVSLDEMDKLSPIAGLDREEVRANAELFCAQLVQFGMAFSQNALGQNLTERWREKGFTGLTNDEQVAIEGYGQSFVSVMEVQEVAADGRLWVVDIFRPKAERLLLIDRTLASVVSRFTLLLSWFLPLPHYIRIAGVSAVQVPREFLETWTTDLERSLTSARRHRPDLTLEEHLAATFYRQIQRIKAIGQERRTAMLRQVDLCRAIARFKFNAVRSEIENVLSSKPELRATTPEAGDGFDKPLQQFDWLRRGESKELEKEMIAPFQHGDSEPLVGGLAILRLYADRLVLETFSRQKFHFARKQLKKWLGQKLILETELIEDLAKMMAERESSGDSEASPRATSSYAAFASGSTSSEATRLPEPSPMPQEVVRKATQSFYEDTYRKFPDQPIPMLENATPRQAAHRPSLRPRLIELMKIHIHGIEEVNRQQGTQLSLDWLLDELRIPELRAGQSHS
jgi:hypothetical protein